MYTITGTITSATQVGTSANGNPTYRVNIIDTEGQAHTIRTKPDSGYSYGITNREYRDMVHVYTVTTARKLIKVVGA